MSEETLARALSVLRRSGIWRVNYAPPIYQLIWALKIPVRPPHFGSFLSNFVSCGIAFGALWGALMWLFVSPPVAHATSAVVVAAVTGGILFGLCMAVYYLISARSHGLPPLQSITDSDMATPPNESLETERTTVQQQSVRRH